MAPIVLAEPKESKDVSTQTLVLLKDGKRVGKPIQKKVTDLSEKPQSDNHDPSRGDISRGNDTLGD